MALGRRATCAFIRVRLGGITADDASVESLGKFLLPGHFSACFSNARDCFCARFQASPEPLSSQGPWAHTLRVRGADPCYVERFHALTQGGQARTVLVGIDRVSA